MIAICTFTFHVCSNLSLGCYTCSDLTDRSGRPCFTFDCQHCGLPLLQFFHVLRFPHPEGTLPLSMPHCLEYLPDLHICAARRLPGSVILRVRATDRSEQADTFLLALLIVSCFSLLDKGLLGLGRDLDLAKYFQQRHVAMYNCYVALCIILPLYTTGDFCLTKITSHGNNGIH